MKTSLFAIVVGTLALGAIPASAQVAQSSQKAYCLQKGTSGTSECACAANALPGMPVCPSPLNFNKEPDFI
jgi:hypothetical protein